MKTALFSPLILLLAVGCAAVREPPASRCPYEITSASADRLTKVQAMVRSRVGIAGEVSVSGPYDRSHLDWLALHGRWENRKKKTSSMMIDAISSDEIVELFREATPVTEIYFWHYFSGSSAFPSEGSGFVAVDQNAIVGFVETFHGG